MYASPQLPFKLNYLWTCLYDVSCLRLGRATFANDRRHLESHALCPSWDPGIVRSAVGSGVSSVMNIRAVSPWVDRNRSVLSECVKRLEIHWRVCDKVPAGSVPATEVHHRGEGLPVGPLQDHLLNLDYSKEDKPPQYQF